MFFDCFQVDDDTKKVMESPSLGILKTVRKQSCFRNGILQFSLPTETTPSHALFACSLLSPLLLCNGMKRRIGGTKGKDHGNYK